MTDVLKMGMVSPPEAYQRRRAALASVLSRPLVLLAGHAPPRNSHTNVHEYRAGSSYLYFGGPPLEGAALLIEPDGDGVEGSHLYVQRPGPDDALWTGEVPAAEYAAELAGIAATNLHDVGELRSRVQGKQAAAVIPQFAPTVAQARQLGLEAATEDERLAIIELRLTKDEHELAAMRCAAAVAMDAHRAALAAIRVGAREADVAAAYEAVLVANNCRHSYSPIITVRGEILHAHGHFNELRDGQMLLMDAGAEEPGGYAADMTRTIPVNGEFTEVQLHLYRTVLRALREGTAACTPGVRYRDVHDASAKIICEGLVQAELLRGDPAELAQRFAHTLFFPHGLGHLIGLDVHDLRDFGDDLSGYDPGRERRKEFGNYALRLDRDLRAGMTLTVEPGIYLVPAIWQREDLVKPFADAVNRAKVDALLADEFGGIRIEHTIAVRGEDEGGPEILSRDLPTDPAEVTALVGVARR